jgi:DNA-binding MarR family transcriptional regulator
MSVQKFDRTVFENKILQYISVSQTNGTESAEKEVSLGKQTEVTDSSSKKAFAVMVDDTFKEGNQVVVYCAIMNITITYIHVDIAEIIAEMTRLGFKVIVVILDTAMVNHAIFLDLLRENPGKSSLDLIEKSCSDMASVIASLGGDFQNFRIVKFSEILKKASLVSEGKILFHLFDVISHVRMEKVKEYLNQYLERAKEKKWAPLSAIFSDCLDVIFAYHIHELVPDFCSKPASVLFRGSPQYLLHQGILNVREDENQYGKNVQVMQSIYIPRLPDFTNKQGNATRYMDINFSVTSIRQYVEMYFNNTKKENQCIEISNLYNYFKQFLGSKYSYPEGPKSEKTHTDLSQLIAQADFEKNKALWIEAITENFSRIFDLVRQGLSKKETFGQIFTPKNLADFDLISQSKLQLLALCDGTLSQREISKKSGLDDSTVSVYLSQLKKKNLITTNESNKPVAVYKEIKVDLQSLKLLIEQKAEKGS